MRSLSILALILAMAFHAKSAEFSFATGAEIVPEFNAGDFLLAAFTDNKIIVDSSYAYDGEDGSFVHRLVDSGGLVTLTDTHGDYYVANCPRCNESPVRLWDVESNALLHRFVVDETNFTVSPPGFWGVGVAVGENYVASSDQRGNTAVFSIATGEQILDLPVERGPDFSGQPGLGFFGDKLLKGSTGRRIDGEVTPSVILVDVPTGEIELEITPDVIRDGLSFGSGVGLSDDALFVHDGFEILKYDYSGNLLASVEDPILSTRQFEYSGGYIRVARSIYDEDLNLVLEHSEFVVSIMDDRFLSYDGFDFDAVTGSTIGNFSVHTIPEPTGYQLGFFAVLCLGVSCRSCSTESR